MRLPPTIQKSAISLKAKTALQRDSTNTETSHHTTNIQTTLFAPTNKRDILRSFWMFKLKPDNQSQNKIQTDC